MSLVVVIRSSIGSGLLSGLNPSFEASNEAPTAAFTSEVTGLTVQFTDTSTDDDGEIVAWDWDFGDGTTHGTTQNPSHTYATSGTKTVVLTVTDDGDETDDVSHNVAPVTVLPTVAAVAARTEGTGNVTPTLSTHVTDDILYILAEGAAGEAISLGTANGFAELGSDSPAISAGTSAGSRLAGFWIRATSNAMTAPVITDPGNHCIATCLTIRGCPTTGDPWDVISSAVSSGVGTTATITGDTTTAANCLVIVAIATPSDVDTDEVSNWANASLASITELFNESSATPGNGGGIAIISGTKVTAGAYGNTTATIATSSNWAGITVAFKPKGTP